MIPIARFRDWWHAPVVSRLDRIEANAARESERDHLDRALSQLDRRLQMLHEAQDIR